MTLATLSDGVVIAIVGAVGALFTAMGTLALKGLFAIAKHSATFAVNTIETKAEVSSLRTTISTGLETQTREIGKVVDSVDKLTHAVDEHSRILHEHDERLRSVESAER